MKLILICFCFILHTFAATVRKRPRTDSESVPDVVQQSRAVYNMGITVSGRIVEAYNATVVTNHYGPWLTSMLVLLTEKDKNTTRYIPNTSFARNETTHVGLLHLGHSLAVSKQSVLYTIKEHPGMLLKYQANCIELDFQRGLIEKPFLHPSVVEFAFTRRAFRFGLAPNVVGLSPPTQLCERKEGKCRFQMSDYDFDACKADLNSSFRYMIMERVGGMDLYSYKFEYPNETLPFEVGMMIGEHLVHLLENLHNRAKIVHGDIHSANIMIESIDADSVSMKFIDFARSFENVERPTKKFRSSFWSSHQLYSPWELAGHYPAPRDDVYRAIELIARLINPPEYTDFLDFVTGVDYRAIMAWKTKKNIFGIPKTTSSPIGPFDPVDRLKIDVAKKEKINSLLVQILSFVREMKDDVNAVPRYAEITDAFRQCRLLARGGF
jgi:serine/threonine protein kinase